MRGLVVSLVLVASPSAFADPKVDVGGYVETYFTLHAQDPSNHVVNLRAFDLHSRSFRLSNAALDLKGEAGAVTVHIVGQVGDTPIAYYASEPQWRYLQAANLTAKAPHDFVIEAGLFPSPIGPEVLPIKDNWNWSRSNLFYGLPFYHLGAMLSHPLGDSNWVGKVHVYNGWNQIEDTNNSTSFAVSAAYTSGKTSAQVLYFGGVERPAGAPEGKAFRNLFDALVQFAVTDDITLMVHGDAGVEPNDIGTSAWAAAATYGKFQLTPTLYAAVRADYFYEKVARGGGMTATPIFWPVTWVAEGTATLAYQPVDHVSVRLEYRHDQAAAAAYFGGDVTIDAMTMAAIPNRDMQDTVTLGATAWF